MAILLKNHLLNNLSLSIFALLCSYGLWNILSRSSKTTVTIAIPVYFYNKSQSKIDAPATIDVTIIGKRSLLKEMLYTSSIHIDARDLKNGINTITLTRSMFDIPINSTLIKYNPTMTIIREPIH